MSRPPVVCEHCPPPHSSPESPALRHSAISRQIYFHPPELDEQNPDGSASLRQLRRNRSERDTQQHNPQVACPILELQASFDLLSVATDACRSRRKESLRA